MGHVSSTVDASLPDEQQVLLWIDEDDHIARAAYEVTRDRARLIGVRQDGSTEFPGVQELLACHTERAEFTMTLDISRMNADQQARLDEGNAYISDYNAALSRWWEQERESCE